jgi:hypothetical protein
MKRAAFIIIYALILISFGFSQSLQINEFLAKNYINLADEFNEYDDWVEIANTGNEDINLNGFFITDNILVKTKCELFSADDELVVPANGYLLLWADGNVLQGSNHLNFKLSSEKGVIALFSPSLHLIDSVSYKMQRSDISMGRHTEDPSVWKYYSEPTPGAKNSTSAFSGFSGTVNFSIPSGIYDLPVQVSMTSSKTGDSIYYSTDNSDPQQNSNLFTEPVQVDQTQVLRASSFKNNFIPGEITSHIYLNKRYTLPVLAVITDSLNLFGRSGIYTMYSQPWEKFCQLKFLSPGDSVVESNAGIRIQGASSITMPKKSFRLYFRKGYGNGKLNYPVFGDPQFQEFDKLILKSGYDDDITTPTGTLLRDALVTELWNKTGGLPQLSSWVILYLNHRYWGIYNLRESIDENFIRAKTGYSDFELVRFRNGGADAVFGSLTEWSNMYDFFMNSDFSLQENYDHLATMLDMDDFINLMAFVQCTRYYSFGWGISMYRPKSPGAKWKVSIWDADRSFSEVEWNGFENTWNNTEGYLWAWIFPQKLFENEEFGKKCAQRINELNATVFKPENSIAVLDSLYNIIKPEMADEFNRWNKNNTTWEENVEAIRDFLRRRPAILDEQIKVYFSDTTETPDTSIILPLPQIQIFPNPFSGALTIRLNLPKAGFTNVSVYSVDGRLMNVLYSDLADEGELSLEWNGDLTGEKANHGGVFIVRISAPEIIHRMKVIKKPE